MPSNRRPTCAPQPRGRGRAGLVLVGLAVVGAAGCSQPTQASTAADAAVQTPVPQAPADAGASTQALADGSSFLVAAPTNGQDEAIVSGRLALIGGNCVGLEQPGGGETSTLAFPHGTHPSDDGQAIVLPDGVKITLGDPIVGGGGSNTLQPGTTAFDPWPDAPSGCAQATYLSSIYDVSIGEAPKA